MFKLKIDTMNAAFASEQDGMQEQAKIDEVMRILQSAIERLNAGATEAVLYDYNGNPVGEYKLTKR